MRVEIILATPVCAKLNGSAKAVFQLLDEASVLDRRVVDKSFCGTVSIWADIPPSLITALWRCERVISIRSDPGS